MSRPSKTFANRSHSRRRTLDAEYSSFPPETIFASFIIVKQAIATYKHGLEQLVDDDLFLMRIKVVKEVLIEYVAHNNRLLRVEHGLGVVDEGRQSLHIVRSDELWVGTEISNSKMSCVNASRN